MSPGDCTVLVRALPVNLRLTVPQRRQLRTFAAELSRQIGDNGALVFLLTSDAEMQSLNQQFRGHDYPTDVLSFPSPAGSATLGEIAISVERATAQASDFGHTLLEEIYILMLHGALHLAGHDHETDDGEMARAEARWRSHFQLPTGLIERVTTLAERAR